MSTALVRRGFLGTLAAAQAGNNVAYDPVSRLWVPKVHDLVKVRGRIIDGQVVDEDLQRFVALSVELNELAVACARALSERLFNRKNTALVLRDVQYKLTGNVVPNLIEVEDEGEGTANFFEQPRLMKPGIMGWSTQAWMNDVVSRVAFDAAGYDIYAPLGVELRPGDSFADNMAIGVGTDPESGVSVRVTRWEHDEGSRRRNNVTYHGLEVAGAKFMRLPALPGARPQKRLAPPSFVLEGDIETDRRQLGEGED